MTWVPCQIFLYLFIYYSIFIFFIDDNTSWICPEKVEDETLHKYSFDDIVLPLPGHSVHYPDNEGLIDS